jgi:hypothetical protein
MASLTVRYNSVLLSNLQSKENTQKNTQKKIRELPISCQDFNRLTRIVADRNHKRILYARRLPTVILTKHVPAEAGSRNPESRRSRIA